MVYFRSYTEQRAQSILCLCCVFFFFIVLFKNIIDSLTTCFQFGFRTNAIFAILYFTVGTPLALEYHAINSVYVLLSFFICSKPVRVLHFIYPEIYMVIYIVFTIIYQLGGNNPAIYWILDWNEPVRAMYTVLAVICVAVPLVHMTFFGLHILRDRIYKCCEKQPGIEDVEYEDKEVREGTV